MSISAIAGLVTALIPLVMKLFFAPKNEHGAIIDSIMAKLAKVRVALDKADETEGDTSAIEDIINGK